MRGHLFEFMDESWVPTSLRMALRDVLETCNSKPFRRYYSWLVKEIIAIVKDRKISAVVELGAGKAPITRQLLEAKGLPLNVKLVPCDINPDRLIYEELANRFPGRVIPEFEPVDFGQPRKWHDNALLVLSATFHHLSHQQRVGVLRNLEDSGARYIIAESIRHNLFSFLGCLMFGWFFALATPVMLFRQPGNLRRILWCWLLPVAPICFVWDGIVSVRRCWTETEWGLVLCSLGKSSIDEFRVQIKSPLSVGVFCTEQLQTITADHVEKTA